MGRKKLNDEQNETALARQGASHRVRVKVDATRAPVMRGGLLATGDVSGAAMHSEPVVVGGRKIHAPGTVIGKALKPLVSGTGEMLVLLSLR